MRILRKKTAAEKMRKEDQREAKKELRQDKRETRKEAREERKDIRKDTRAEKKQIRKSDATPKETREAKKDARQEKRDDLKEVRTEKKSEVRAIKRDVKEVRRSLDIKLPSKAANVALLREDLRDIAYSESGVVTNLEIEDALEILDRAYERAKELSAKGLRMLEDVVDGPRDGWVSRWSASGDLVTWFGEADEPNHVKDVHDRLRSVNDRLNKQITIRLYPQRSPTTNAQNNGTFFEPKTFKVFPKLFENSLDDTTQEIGYDYMASVMIHELIHLWFTDQKLDGEKVYDEAAALALAKENPRKARRSAENYERYCMLFA